MDLKSMVDNEDRLKDFAERYESGTIPWDDELPPPEIIALTQEIAPGRALDLGCGYGRTTIYLAQHGWQVDGVDFVPRAIETARERARKAKQVNNVRFHTASVTQLDFLHDSYDLVVDIGCMHSFSEAALVAYRDNIFRLLRVGGLFLLFAHLGDDNSSEEQSRWVKDKDLLALFAEGFELSFVEYGETQVGDNPPWKSAWYRFRRVDNSEQ